MADELERLKRKRTTLRTIVSKLLKKVEDSLKVIDRDELMESHELLLERKGSLKELDDQVHKLIEIESLESDVGTSEEYQEKCSRTLKRINRVLEEDKPPIQYVDENRVKIQNVQNSVKLPKLVLEKYSGDPKKFTEFWNTFESTIEKNSGLTKIEKFAYLKTLLVGAASNVVASLELTEKNYDECLKTLKERFGNKEIIISQFMNKLLNLEPVKNQNNIKALRKLIDEIEIAVRNLESQGVTKGSFSQLLIPLVLKSIPEEFVLEFNRKKRGNEEINVNDLLDFLKTEIECREMSQLLIQEKKNTLHSYSELAKSDSKKYSKNVPTAANFNAVDNRTCIFCEKSHSYYCCDKNIKDKMYKLRNQNRCFKCFRKFHVGKFCRDKSFCSKCGSQTHHESICTRNSNRNEMRSVSNQKLKDAAENESNLPVDEKQISTLSVSQNYISCKKNALLQTCSVLAHSGNKSVLTNLILDSGATRSFIHTSLVKRLNLKIIGEEKLSVYSFGMKSAKEKKYKVTELVVSDSQQINKIKIRCLVTDIITNAQMFRPSCVTYKSLEDLGLHIADVKIKRVEILIGIDFYYQIVKGERINIAKELFAISTIFGWVAAGLQQFERDEEMICQNSAIVNFSSCVQDSLRSLWVMDCLGIHDDDSALMCNEESELISGFERNIKFINDRYFVRLLWKTDPNQLENNFSVALKRFETLKNRLIRNPEILQQYKGVIDEQLKEDIIEECTPNKTELSYFMPHREIIKPNEKTSCRIVYDASACRTKGVKSLNDFLDIGPSLTPLLLDIILNFRKFEIAFNGDIAKAFLMIGILESDRDYLKFLWFGDKDQEYKILRFKRLAFGLRCSPAILAMTIKYHIKNYKNSYPESYKMLDTSMYVDDLYYGADTIEDAFRLSSDAVEIFRDAGMHLRKLCSNSKELNSLWISKGLDVTLAKESKFLGMIWTPDTDSIRLNTAFIKNPVNVRNRGTKRILLRTVASIFDPLGLFQPYVMKMKLLLQHLWTLGLDWDEALPSDLNDVWVRWLSEIDLLDTFLLPRKFFNCVEKSEVTLHVFADASPRAYGAVCYFRYHSATKIQTCMIISKGRVAPLKSMTLPRMELMAALVAAKLAKYLTNTLPNLYQQIFLWSDSQITIHWIKGCARNWKPFVANRVSEIQSITDPERWFHCSGKENPADLISRGEKAYNLINNPLWFQGPSWLSQPEGTWPINYCKDIDESSVSNEKRSQTIEALQISVFPEHFPVLFDLNRFSRLLKVYRVTAYVMRFILNCKGKSVKIMGPLNAAEIQKAEMFWIKSIQQKHFSKEIRDLSVGKMLDKKSEIYSLNPKLDNEGLLRLTGRLQFSSLDFGEKHPILLPYKDYFCELIISDSHNKVLHAGVESTLAQIREKFWIIKGRQCVKSTINKCVVCKRYKVQAGTQEIAPLPPDRVLDSPPFAVTGLDFAGPFFTKENNEKHYLLLFTCAITRAIHLELVPSMQTEHFLLAFRKFIARRGLCSTIWSDNARTFKRADIELKKLWNCVQHKSIKDLFSSHGIQWKYIVEKGAWWGGFWERHFRTIKTCLRKIVGRSSLSLNELETVFIEIEAMINSRPITYISDDPSEPSPLTPAHFLIGKRLFSLPVTRLSRQDFQSSKTTMIKRFKYQQTLLSHFWNRWRKSYLMSLRSMNICPPKGASPEFKVGNVVLIHDDRAPRNMWTMGRIVETYKGRDGKIRSCLLKIKTGEIRRPVQLLYNLEVHDD